MCKKGRREAGFSFLPFCCELALHGKLGYTVNKAGEEQKDGQEGNTFKTRYRIKELLE